MNLSKDEKILFQHFNDLIQLSYYRGIPAYSQFTSLHESWIAFQALDDFYDRNWNEGRQVLLFGGYPEAERKMLCFLPTQEEYGQTIEEADFPICCVRIRPVNKRFCEDLNHRDYLGTVMGLGLTRDQIGDILVVREENACIGYLFCKKDKADLLTGLTRIRHTTVAAEQISYEELAWEPEFQEITESVSSFRLDAVLSAAIRLSRSQALALIQEGQVFLNGRCCTENARKLSEGEVFSVRGYGKFIFEKVSAQSKKGRHHIVVKKYI